MKPRLRASNMDRFLSCPGSMQVLAAVGERARDDGHEGVFLHWAIAARLIRELGALPPEGGLPDPEVPAGYAPNTNSLWIIDWAVEHVRKTIPADWSLMVEVEFEHEFERWIGTGHADLLAQSPDGLKIKAKDWKCVYVAVDAAEENEQVLTYCVLTKLDWPDTHEIEFEICQPRLSGDERVSSVVVAGDELDRCVASLDSRVCAALGDLDLLNTGIKQCKWCVGPSCPAIQALNLDMKLRLTPPMLAKLKATPDDPVLGDFVVNANVLSKPIKTATELLHERIDAQGYVDAGCGTRITRKIVAGDLKITDPTKFREAVEVQLPDKKRQDKCMSWAKGALIEQIAEARNIHKSSEKEASAEKVWEGTLEPLTTQGERRLIVFT